MNPFFRKLPLPVKLMLIGIIPLIFLFLLSYELYQEKKQKVSLISNYIERLTLSANITLLMNELQTERRYSFQYALTKEDRDKIVAQRLVTDSIIQQLKKNKDLSITKFSNYTFLNNLADIRIALDTSKSYSANAIMQYYTTAIFRLNTLNSSTPASNIYLQPVYQDMIAQKILSEMLTYLGIIRTNIYNVLNTRQYMVETLMGTVGTHEIYNTYETEFLIKASPASVQQYNYAIKNSSLKPTIDYINNVFSTFKFDSTLNADRWWEVSTAGLNELRKLQSGLWKSVQTRVNKIYETEKNKKEAMLVFLILAILFVAAIVTYSIVIINQMLTEIKVAAQKIAMGATDLQIKNIPDDVMGSLARSILKIDENHKQLANAADAIGKGNFDVTVKPRSKEDLLGNSIKRMKKDLRDFTLQKDKIQRETMELMNKKDDFISIASHELKTPVTSLKAYTQILQFESAKAGDKNKEMMLTKMDAQVNKLTALINDLLDTSNLQNGKLKYIKQHFLFNDLAKEIVEEVQKTAPKHEIFIEANTHLEVNADRERIGQVLRNLLANSVKYCDDCEKIIVKIERKDNKALCSVADFGIGIALTEQDKIFNKFYRASGKNLHTYPGLGLGLYISKQIIERHYENIWVESEPAKGSTFYFTLPLA